MKYSILLPKAQIRLRYIYKRYVYFMHGLFNDTLLVEAVSFFFKYILVVLKTSIVSLLDLPLIPVHQSKDSCLIASCGSILE